MKYPHTVDYFNRYANGLHENQYCGDQGFTIGILGTIYMARHWPNTFLHFCSAILELQEQQARALGGDATVEESVAQYNQLAAEWAHQLDHDLEAQLEEEDE